MRGVFMKKKTKSAAGTAVVLLAVLQGISVSIYRKNFFQRCTREVPFWQSKHTEFPELKRIRAEFKNDSGVIFRGYFYYKGAMKKPVPEGKGIIVLANGYLQSHQDYMIDIAYLAEQGFVVFGFDHMGSYESDGERMMGIDQAVIDLKGAISYVEEVTGGEQEIYLYGHSMGAYAGAVVLNDSAAIKKAVLRSGFFSPSLMIYDALSAAFGKPTAVLIPFIFLYRLFLFRGILCKRAVRGIRTTKAQVLILHSEDDTVVPQAHSLYGRRKHFQRKENIMTRLYYGKGHDIARTSNAMRYYFEKERERLQLIEQYGGENHLPKSEIKRYEESIDRKRANEYDYEILGTIADFFQNGL